MLPRIFVFTQRVAYHVKGDKSLQSLELLGGMSDLLKVYVYMLGGYSSILLTLF